MSEERKTNAQLEAEVVAYNKWRGENGERHPTLLAAFRAGMAHQASTPTLHREPIEADREALVGMIAAIIDPDAMKSLEQHKAEWREIVANVHIDPGPRPVDREAIGEKCAQKRFDEQAIYRERALAKAGAILSAHRLAFSTPAASEAEARDSERLNFLDECNRRLNAHYGTDYGWELILNHNVNRLMLGPIAVDLNDSCGGKGKLPSCRDAIDKAMARSATPSTEGRKGEDQADG